MRVYWTTLSVATEQRRFVNFAYLSAAVNGKSPFWRAWTIATIIRMASGVDDVNLHLNKSSSSRAQTSASAALAIAACYYGKA